MYADYYEDINIYTLACCFWIRRTGYSSKYLVRKQHLFPPSPSENDIFPLLRHVFYSFYTLFALILPNFAFIFRFPPIFSSSFLFIPASFPFLTVSFTLNPFSPNLGTYTCMYCSLLWWQIQEIKRMYSASLAHGLFITKHKSVSVADNMHGINIHTMPFLFLSLICFIPLYMGQPPLFYLLGDPSFSNHGANIHPLSSLASNQLLTPCCLTLPEDTHGLCYMFT
jgi:hypothetical protein